MALAVVRTDTDDTDVAAIAPGNLESAITDEIFAHATPEQAQSFFAAVGRRLAAGHELPLDGALADLEQAMNHAWRDADLGQVTLAMTTDGIVIDHRGHAGRARSENWQQAAPALLHGAYATWFEAIGGPEFKTRLVKQTSERIILHHGL